jgi:hypothetical protein
LVYGELPLFYAAAMIGASSIALFISIKVKRGRNLRSVLFLLLDFVIVAILPFFLVTLIQLSSVAIQRLFLSVFLFYLAMGVIYLLFTSAAEKFLIPFTSLYLLFAVLHLFVRLYFDGYGFGLVLFVYCLVDEITLTTFSALFLAVLIPLCRQLGSKIGILLDSRHLASITSVIQTKLGSSEYSASNKNQEAPSRVSLNSPLRNAVKLFREGRYRQCIESCDTEVERVILSKLVELYSDKIDLPMSLQNQISKLMSKGVSAPGEDILRLRELRNSLTMSYGEVKAHQVKWAIMVVRRTERALSSSNASQNHSAGTQEPQYSETL